MPAVIVFRSKPKMNCKSRLFCLFFLIHTLFRKVEWDESIIEGYEESRGAFPPFPSYSESDARNCSNNENEVNRAEAAYVHCAASFSLLYFADSEKTKNERTKPGNRREQSPLALERRWRVSQLRLTGFAKTHFTVNSLSDRHLLTPRNQGTYYTSITYLKYTEFLKYYKNTLFFQVLQIL